MFLVQLSGLSGAGKSTIASRSKSHLQKLGYKVEIIDADIYRPIICPDLGFSRADRIENIRRLSYISNLLATNGIITLLAAINPYEATRLEVKQLYRNVITVHVNCDLDTLIRRDPKGLYFKARLPDGHINKVYNLSGINDLYELPANPDLVINTHLENEEESVGKFVNLITQLIAVSR